jgi:hypothetical protein
MEKCIICNLEFKNKGELSKHINRNHEGTEKYYIHNLKKSKGKCKICGSPTKFINIWRGYKNACDKKECKDLYGKMKMKEGLLKKYGVKSPLELEWVRLKIRESNKKRSKQALEKRKKTNLKKYGVENPYQSPEIKEKIKITNLKKYGNSIPQKTKKTKEKTRQTNLKKYKGNSPQSDPIIYKKSQNTKKEKYGDKNYNNPKQTQKTLLSNTGYSFALQNPLSKEKFKKTSLKNFGETHPMQNETVFYKSLKSGFKSKRYKNTQIFYQGSYELDFLERFYDRMSFLIRGPRITYNVKEEKHYYFPDFYFPPKNLIIEIKSKYWNQKHLELNKIKAEACLNLGYNYILLEDLNYLPLQTFLDK